MRSLRRALLSVFLLFAAGGASAEVKTGAYRGDGTAGRSIVVGFQPAAVIVKGNDSDVTDDLTSAVMRTATMAGDASKPLKGDQALQANAVQSLDANGFTVGSDRKVNAAGIDYYWVAFGADADLATGSFVGNGTAQSLSGLGFSPDYVVLLAETSRRAVQRPASAPDSHQFWAGSSHPDAVTSLDPDGFSVSSSLFANETGVTYHYAAWNAVEGETVVGAYVGSGTDDRGVTTPGLHPEYLVGRTSTGTEDPFQRMRIHSGDVSVDFRGAVQANRIQSFESTGFEVGTDTRVNASGQTYFYVAFGACQSCEAVAISETATTVSASTPGYALTFDEAAGGGVSELYDLREDPGASVDLAGAASVGTSLHDEGIQSGGVWYNLPNSPRKRLELLEATSARARVRQTSRHADGAGNVLPGPLTTVDHGVHPVGRLSQAWLRWNQSSSSLAYTTNERDLNLHLQASPPLDGWAAFSESGALGTQPGSDDFLLGRIDAVASSGAGAFMDLLHVPYEDWADADSTSAPSFPANEWRNVSFTESTGGSIASGSRDGWSAITYLGPVDLSGPQDGKVVDRASDYRNPAVPILTVGNGWFDASENTSAGDFFNEAEAAYLFTFDPLNGLDFTLDGGATPRFGPFFKIRGWRSLDPTPDVTLVGTELAWRAAEQTGDVTPSDDVSSNDETHRVLLRAPFLTRSGSEVRVKLRANSTQALTASGFRLAEADPADERDVVDATSTPVTFGGSSSVTIPAGGAVWSDWTAFPVDEARSYSLTMYLDPLVSGSREWFGPTTEKYLLVGDQTGLLDWSSSAPAASTRIDALEEVEVRESLSLSSGSGYRSDLKPVSRAYFARDVAWYSTASSSTAVTSPDVGAPGAVVGPVSFVPGRFGGGVALDADGEYLTVPASQVFDPASGAVELWYRPDYDFGSGPSNDDDAIFGYWIDNSNYFYVFHEPYVNGPGDNEGINFDVRVGPSVSDVDTGAGPSYPVWWRAGEWVHLRFTWDLAAGRLETYIDGVLAASGSYVAAAPLPPDDVLYVGERNRFGTKDNHPRGALDEITFFSAASTPSSLAHGGLASDAREHLASASRNAQLAFTGVDGLARGEYLFLGADSKFSGLNVDLAVNGAGVSAGGLEWEYWSNASGWKSLEVPGFTDETDSLTRQGAVYWPDLPDWDPYAVNGGPELYTLRVHLAAGEAYTTPPTEGVIETDVLLFQYCESLTRIDQRFSFAVPAPTAVALVGFRAVPGDARVALEWETGSEVQNLGFHLYRAEALDGPYERITDVLVPGLGSSPEGASYRWVDDGVANGVELFYLLEDVESTGRRRRHGPVSAVPSADAEIASEGGFRGVPEFRNLIAYGEPEKNRLTVSERGPAGAAVELVVQGFYAEPLGDGTVRIVLPGLETGDEDESLAVARAWVRARKGRKVELVRAATGRIDALGLRPAHEGVEDAVALEDGTVQRRRRRRRGGAVSSEGWSVADVASVAYQGDVKKALVELRPFYWDASSGELLLARRIVATLSFREPDAGDEVRRRRAPRRGNVVARLAATKGGLQAVPFEDVKSILRRRFATSDLRLSRLGELVPFHVEPDDGIFGPGSVLYFVAAEEYANPYGPERVYELELGEGGLEMERATGALEGSPVTRYRERVEREEDRLYQAALVQAEDLWLWDVLLSPSRKGYPFAVSELADGEPARLELRLQGGSDFPVADDHHVRVYLNAGLLGETFWEGKLPERWEVELGPASLREGENVLELENVGDTGAAYSMVYLDGFAVTYSRRARAGGEGLDGVWPSSGLALVESPPASPVVVEIDGGITRWVAARTLASSGALGFPAGAGRRYLVEGSAAAGRPSVRSASPPSLLEGGGADYLVIGPRAFLEAASPLLERRRRQGLVVATAAVEQVYEEFGGGEPRPEAIRELIRRAYLEWSAPRLRYVLLLGDATYDFKDVLGTGIENRVPPLMKRTRFLWTVSDPSYGAVHGDDDLPDVAVGRLPAASLEELRFMMDKIAAYEDGAIPGSPRVVIVADDPDAAGDFEANARELESTVFSGRAVDVLSLRELGVSASRLAIRGAFAGGAAMMSYIGHGGIHLWASENLLDITAVDGLSSGAPVPLVVSANCLNGYFHFPYFDSLSERLVEAEERGAVAAIAPSGLSWDAPAHRFHRALAGEMVGGAHRRLGDVLLAAQEAYTETGASTEVLSIFHLLGDPALLLRDGAP